MELIVKVFVGPWCPACQKVLPGLNALSDGHPDVGYEVLLSTDKKEEFKLYGITKLPTVIFEKHNNVVTRLQGVQPISLYEELVERWK